RQRVPPPPGDRPRARLRQWLQRRPARRFRERVGVARPVRARPGHHRADAGEPPQRPALGTDARLPLSGRRAAPRGPRRWLARRRPARRGGHLMHHRDSGSGTVVDPAVREELRDNLRPAQWRNPAPADRYGLVVVGAGAAGLAAAREAAASGARVALVERGLLGGDRLNFGCEPSKALVRTARAYAEMRDARSHGAVVPPRVEVDFHAAMERVLRLRARLSRVISPRMLREAGIDLFF